jgi:glycosyltransferase involved in cell wall biosynthesis
MVVNAFGQLLERTPQWQGRLVVVGRRSPQTPELKKILDRFPKPERVVLLDGVSRAEQVRLLRGSLALVSASKMGGFDYPVMESKAEGLPTIIRDIPVHRELHEGSSLFFDIENDLDFLSKAFDGLVGGIDLWMELSVLGRSLAASLGINDQQSKIKCLVSQQCL